MRRIFLSFICLIIFQVSTADASLYQSWYPSSGFVAENKAEFHAPYTMYLKHSYQETNLEILDLYEKCLITYCALVIDEKNYDISAEAGKKLDALDVLLLPSSDEYQRLANFSRRMNAVLPYRDTAVVGHLRRPFAYFWPTIDVYAAVEKIRAVYPLCGAYMDVLLKSPNANLEDVKKQLLGKVNSPINGAELLTLFAIHIFDSDGDRDLSLAELEFNALKKFFKKEGPEVMYQVVSSSVEKRKEAIESKALSKVLSMEGLHFSDAEASELDLSSDPEDENIKL